MRDRPTIVARLLNRDRGAPLAELTERERDVISLMAEGHSNAAICATLFLSPKTVEAHIRHTSSSSASRKRRTTTDAWSRCSPTSAAQATRHRRHRTSHDPHVVGVLRAGDPQRDQVRFIRLEAHSSRPYSNRRRQRDQPTEQRGKAHPATQAMIVAPRATASSRFAGNFYGPYWARTSDPQLVELAAVLQLTNPPGRATV